MTIQECIDRVDSLKPNQYTIKEKVEWLSFIELRIINDLLKTHEGYDGRYDLFTGYSEDKLTITMIAPSPYDRLYTKYLEMKIDEANGETTRYNNSATMFNTYYADYKKFYNKWHMPLDPLSKADKKVPTPAQVGLTDAEYDSLVKDLTYKLTEYFSHRLSDDKIYEIVNAFVSNNIQMLKGKDGRDGVDGKDGYTPRKNVDYFDGKKGDKGDPGYTPQRGTDYFNDSDKAEIHEYINSLMPVPDYEQNDPKKSDYIKNRPFYDSNIFLGETSYTWDGESPPDADIGYKRLVEGDVVLVEVERDGVIETFEDTIAWSEIAFGYVGELSGDTPQSVNGINIKVDDSMVKAIFTTPNVSATVRAYKREIKYLDEIFIPNTIARVEDVERIVGIANTELESILAGGVD